MQPPRQGTGARRLQVRPGTARASGASPDPARDRFRGNDAYRASREWMRYEGTAQRDLFRILRERFLARHAPPGGWALDVGSGPGRFTARLGGTPAPRRIALDIGAEMLRELRERWPRGPAEPPWPELILGDALHPPFARGSFDLVAAMGNLLGFAADEGDGLLEQLMGAPAPGGTLVLEVAPGPGEHSSYLHRLPARSVARLLRSPPRAVASRIEREGFAEEAVRKKVPGAFHRIDPTSLHGRLVARGFRVIEVVAVAPALGPEASRTEAVHGDAKAWQHLLEVEEALGRSPARWPSAAAVLLAAVAPD